MTSEKEHRYTSTGIKLWRHPDKLKNYKEGKSRTVISTHISPEGACNLKCPYCSVTYRDTSERMTMDTIMQYVIDLKFLGLKAVILTGGGEPTAYKHFNTLVQWLKFDQNLSVALITNGTLSHKVNPKTWGCFSWVRVSINSFPGWEDKIRIPHNLLSEDCTVGCSHVFTVRHETPVGDRREMLQRVSKVADNCGAEYIRILPDCLLPQDKLIVQHRRLEELMTDIDDPRMFQQHKLHGAPKCSTCHQSYFRPYLSEVGGGTVFPCDSVVLNKSVAYFSDKFALCKASEILDYMAGEIKHRFDARECTGCVFTNTVNMLNDFVLDGKERFDEFPEPLVHEEFV